MKTSSNILAEIKLAYRKHQISELELEIKVIEYAEMYRKEQLLIRSVVDTSVCDKPDKPVERCKCCKGFHEPDVCCYD